MAVTFSYKTSHTLSTLFKSKTKIYIYIYDIMTEICDIREMV